ncbi:MAG: hypothetical protein HQK50_11330 [Oligoflexia bacterium]|nr:hypothetical protein [Oligoflexia bacterium]MBF0366156.1 hypothetical protein [Oligoflexia bacterium]
MKFNFKSCTIPELWKFVATHLAKNGVDVDGILIKIFSPTDCIRDRLASYIHFKANDCLDQAIMVAKKHPFNIAKVKTWCEKEGGRSEFENFINRLKRSKEG